MLKQLSYAAVTASLAVSAMSMAPATAQGLCQNGSGVGTVCAGAVAGLMFNGQTTTTSPNPSITASTAAASETAVGPGAAGATASASVGFGAAHLFSSATIPAAVASTGFVSGIAYANFNDQIVVGSTNVNAKFTSILEGSFNSFQPNAFTGGPGGQSSVFLYDTTLGGIEVMDLEVAITAGLNSGSLSRDIALLAGHTYELFDRMEASAILQGGPYPDGWPDAHFAVADLSNTGLLYIDAPDGGLSFLSGHNYSTNAVGAVPEPSTWAMLLLGFAGIGFMTYRRRGSFVAAATG